MFQGVNRLVKYCKMTRMEIVKGMLDLLTKREMFQEHFGQRWNPKSYWRGLESKWKVKK